MLHKYNKDLTEINGLLTGAATGETITYSVQF